MIPVEIITMLGSAIVGGVLSLMSANQKAKELQMTFMLSDRQSQQKGYQEAREDKGKHVTWVRQFIAVVGIMAVIVWPKFVPVFAPWVNVWVGWTQWNPGFLFIEGREMFTWKAMNGLVITPLDTHLVSSIVGFYLGGAVTRR